MNSNTVVRRNVPVKYVQNKQSPKIAAGRGGGFAYACARIAVPTSPAIPACFLPYNPQFGCFNSIHSARVC